LAFIPLALLLPRPRRLMQNMMFQLTVLGVLGIAIWILVRPGVFAPRYILYTLLLIIPFVAYCTEYATKNESRPRWLAAAIAIFCIVYLTISNNEYGIRVAHNIKKIRVCDPFCHAINTLNNTAEPGARVCSWNYFTFWYRSDLLQCMSTRKDSLNTSSSHETWQSIYDRGFRYVFIDRATHGAGDKILDPKQSPSWLEVKEIFNAQNHRQSYRIYRLTSSDPSRKARITTTEIRPSVWRIVDVEEDKD
jgi:hypothetical protein